MLSAKLVLNNSKSDNHATLLKTLLSSAENFQCMIAFARQSGSKILIDELKKRLNNNLTARFVIGLDFYQTDPSLLEKLLMLSKKHDLELYISKEGTQSTFHPKVFVFKNQNESHAMVGSANLTGGGMEHNYESSVLVKDVNGKLFQAIDNEIEALIENEEIVIATPDLISSYAKRHAIYNAQIKLAGRRTSRAIQQENIDLSTLQDILIEMKLDTSRDGFNEQKSTRERDRELAKLQLNLILNCKNITPKKFLVLYEPLVSGIWRSSGLQRGKNIISKHAQGFQKGLKSLANLGNLSVEDAYQNLHSQFSKVKGAGPNVMTEILHTYDNMRFAVMNQNSVSGMSLANIDGFPSKPSKSNVNAKLYANFCEKAGEICAELGLENFSQFDALLNYAYWD